MDGLMTGALSAASVPGPERIDRAWVTGFTALPMHCCKIGSVAQGTVDVDVKIGPGSVPAGIIVIGICKYYHRAASRGCGVIGALVALKRCAVAGGAVAASRCNGFVGFDHRSTTIRIYVTKSAVVVVYITDQVLLFASVTAHTCRERQDDIIVIQTSGESALVGVTD
jgi:hypothetical protein